MYAHMLLRVALLLLLTGLETTLGRSIPSRSPLDRRSIVDSTLSTSKMQFKTSSSGDNTYPRLASLSDGSILAGYTYVSGTSHILSVLRSTDNGASFSAWGTITSGTGGDLDNVFLIEVPSSSSDKRDAAPTVLAAFRNHDVDATTGAYTYYRITTCRSTDGGQTWAFLGQVVEGAPSATNLGYWEPFMRIGADGQLQLTYSGTLAKQNQQTFRTLSGDGGASWSAPTNLLVHAAGVDLRDGMQGIASTTDASDGRAALVMVFETTQRGAGLFNVEYAVSYDDGATYGNRNTVYVPSSGHNAGSPQIAAVGTQGLAVVFMTDEDVDYPDWPNVASVKTVVSAGLKGGDVVWSDAPTLLSGTDSFWPGVLGMGKKVLAVYDHDANVEGVALSWPGA